MASLVAAHRLWSTQARGLSSCSTVARGLSSCSSWAVEHRLDSCGSGAYCSSACGVTPDQGLNRRALRWQVDSRRIRDCTGVQCIGRQIHAGSGTAPVCSALAGRFTPDQGLHRCAVRWQADSHRIRDCTGVQCVGRRIHARSGTAAACSALAGGFFTTEPPGKPSCPYIYLLFKFFSVKCSCLCFHTWICELATNSKVQNVLHP